MRHPAVAGMFYPRSESECRRLLDECLANAQAPQEAAVGGIVPHAGWVFSGPTAAKVIRALPSDLRDVVLFGAVHLRGVPGPALYPRGAWWTPLGPVEVDEELGKEICEACGDLLAQDAEAHEGEHSIEVQVPFLRYRFPAARIVPIAVPPCQSAAELGSRIGRTLAGRPGVAVLGSSDLTHYGPRYGFAPHGGGAAARKWVREVNDRAIIDVMLDLRADAVLAEFERHENACGPGAIAATLAAARAGGHAHGRLLEYTTSADVRPEWGGEDFVGYAGVIY
jgi:AmmeMemoRadiSam system protein B